MAPGNTHLENNPTNSVSNSTDGLPDNQGATGGANDNENLCSVALVGDIAITELSPPSDPSWPANLILDWRKSNWQEWSRRLSILVDKQAFYDWLEGNIPCPDATTHARACQFWKINDRALRTFILGRVSIEDYGIVCGLPDSHTIYEALRHRHQRFELHAQVLLINEGLDIRFRPGVPFTTTLNAIQKLHARITELGSIDEDKINNHFLTVLLLNGLEEHYPRLQSAINDVLDRPFSSSHDVIRRIELEEALQLLRAKQGLPPVPGSLAVSAKGKEKTRPFCANCKRSNHRTNFCVLPGGKMAGRTIKEAHAAQRVASGKPRGNLG